MTKRTGRGSGITSAHRIPGAPVVGIVVNIGGDMIISRCQTASIPGNRVRRTCVLADECPAAPGTEIDSSSSRHKTVVEIYPFYA
jgi:hypothetical protein